jgi:hypothetical protein
MLFYPHLEKTEIANENEKNVCSLMLIIVAM